MRKFLYTALKQSLSQQVPATGIGLLRCLYGIIVFQEIIFLLYFNALIFDPIPYLDVAFPLIPLFLCFWGLTAVCLMLGWHCQLATIANYCFWIIFVSFTPMRHDFGGGFDPFMTGVGLFLIVLPVDRCFALDNLRNKLRFNKPENIPTSKNQVSILAYFLPVIICLGFLYFDSAIHKLYAEHWRNGLGGWLPSTSPYYISAIDMSWLLNIKALQIVIGYSIFVFQFSFIFLIFYHWGRIALLLVGAVLHIGIILSLNIYPFGLGMLICYVLLVPFSWWRYLAKILTCKSPSLTVYYDADSAAANRIAIIIQHFDVFNAIEITPRRIQKTNDAQTSLSSEFTTLDRSGHIHTDFNAWISVLINMRYSAILGWILLTPGIRQLTNKKYSLNCTRKNSKSNQILAPENQTKPIRSKSYYDKLFEDYALKQPKRFIYYLRKILVLIFLLQLNSTLHYGVIYRNHEIFNFGSIFNPLTTASNSILVLTHTFLGITPHALYLHDHFEGYDQILAITYIDDNGDEQWLPFVSQEGRLLAPNWGRVQSMWANVAVTPNIETQRLAKFSKKITAFWGTKIGLDLNQTTFNIKSKEISTPFNWEHDLRNINLQGQWHNIGIIRWHKNIFSFELSDKIMQK